MTKNVSASEAKAKLSALVAEVAFGGEHIVIERRGIPIAALVSIVDLAHLKESHARSARPQGALALVGAWQEVPEEKLDALISDIYIAREQNTGRSVNLEV